MWFNNDIKTLFLILLFSKVVLLNSAPISIDKDWIEFIPSEPFSAITDGAAIYLDVSVYISKKLDLMEQFDAVDGMFLDGTITGILIAENGKEFVIENKGSSHGKEDTKLVMDYGRPMPTDIEFTKLKLMSDKPLEGINVYWKNFKM